MEKFIKLIKDKLGDKVTLVFDKKYLSDYVGAIQGKADVLVKAETTDDVAAALKLAYENDINIVIRGAGTNLVASTVPEGGLVLDVSNLKEIGQIDEFNQSIEVGCGVKLCDLQNFVESKSWFYPPDPAEKEATIGGNISTNAGGMRAVKYGVTRDYVRELEFVTPQGKVLKLGADTIKDSSGLNLKHLVIGSEGTLGVVTKARLKLIPKPAYTQSALLAFTSLRKALDALPTLFAMSLKPTAIEFVERKVIAIGENYLSKEFPCPEAEAYLIVTFDGCEQDVLDAFNIAKNELKNLCLDFIELTDPKVSSNVWEIRAALAKAVQASGIWEPVDTVVPLSKVADFVDFVNKLSQKEGVRILSFGHAGDGNVHLCIIKDEIPLEKWPLVLQHLLDEIYNNVYELGGLTAAEHGIGKSKRRYFLNHTAPETIALMRAVKAAFDPKGLLNPHDGYAI